MGARVPFPESPRVVYAQNPIVEVICQLRYPTILSIASEPPAAFQELIRDEYPIYRREAAIGGLPDELPPEIAQLVQNLPVFQSASSTHRFYAQDQRRQIAMTTEFIAISENDYTEWDDMRREIERARAGVEQVYQPAFYERVGLRYTNRIDRQALGVADRPWSALLRPEVTGLLGSSAEMADAVHEATSTTVLLLGDEGSGVRVTSGIESGNNDVFVIDADFFAGERSDHERVGTLLDGYNRAAGNLFRWAIEPVLHKALLGDQP
jgi:uncharacterized protein (TIGR04255 family)